MFKRRQSRGVSFATTVVCLSLSASAQATFSIAACDPESRRCGVAVATHNLAVGNSVPFAQADLGAGVSQFETNPLHAAAALDALRRGRNATQALTAALDNDSRFDDGADETMRQLAIVAIDGGAAAHTGQAAGDFAGHQTHVTFSVQGNGLAGPEVLDAMAQRFAASSGPLGERLLSALEAGYAEGGQRIGVTSAALLVATEEGWPVDIDLRADFAPGTAIDELRTMYDASVARTLLFRARRAIRSGQEDQARRAVKRATELAPEWDRIWLTASRLMTELGDNQTAAQYFARFERLNSVWADLIKEPVDSKR